MRINKYFTDNGICSRREADRLIEAGRITINDRKAIMGDRVMPGDIIRLDGRELKRESTVDRIYIMYNKPRGITCTTDPKIRGNIVSAINHKERIFMIGRLDKDSTGLIFLTNDGDIVNKILRAQYGHEKEYIVEINKPVTSDFLHKMSSGVNIGDCTTKPCKIRKLKGNTFSIILTEGKNRQIRRMCEVLDCVVKNLHRIRIMNIHIGDLKLGEWQYIPEDDLNKMLALAADNKN